MVRSEISDLEAYHLLSILLASEILPNRQVSVGYAMTETPDSTDLVLKKLAELLETETIESISICDPQSSIYNYGYPGPKHYLKVLKKFAVPDKKIKLIVSESPMDNINTATEMEMVVEWMKRNNIPEFIIVAPVFHLLRCYLTTLTALVNLGCKNIKVWVQGVPMPVYESVIHSQGKQKGTRAKIAWEEIKKCQTYTTIISPQQALEIHKKHRM